MKRSISFLALVVFLLFSVSALAAEYKVIKARSFTSNCRRDHGWYWLKAHGQYAKWTFRSPSENFYAVVAVCLSTLSTNGVNGGPGYDSQLKISGSGIPPHTTTITLKNEYPLLKDLAALYNISPRDSRGIGYASHGCVEAKISPRRREFTVKVEYNGGHHTAVKKDSLKIIYIAR